MPQSEGRVGLVTGADGVQEPIRLGRTLETIVAQGHGKYFESARNGATFSLSSPIAGTNAAAANVSPVAATTGQLFSGILNPRGSGKNVVVLKAIVGDVSGTPGGGFAWNYIADTTTTAASTGTIIPNLLTASSSTSVCKPLHNVALAGVAGAASLLRNIGGFNGVASGAGIRYTLEETGGDIVAPPGTIIGIAVGAAGATWAVYTSVTWEEVPV